jgi:hypothetical protein
MTKQVLDRREHNVYNNIFGEEFPDLLHLKLVVLFVIFVY